MGDDFFLQQNVVCFVPDDDESARLFLTLDGEWKLTAGMKPDINSARVPWTKLVALGDNLDRTGRIEFWYDFKPGQVLETAGSPPEAAEPNHIIYDVTIYDVEPLEFGRVPGFGGEPSAEFQTVEYRIYFADFRWKFQHPRGGHLRLGLVNKSDETAPLSNMSLILHCIERMGLKAGIIDPDVKKVDPVRNLEWRGNHAPTELENILDQIGAVFIPESIGTFRIDMIGKGDLPVIPELQQLPYGEDHPGLDRRGKKIIITSEPNAAIRTITIVGPSPDTWEYVAIDPTDNQWKALKDFGCLNGKTPLETIRTDFNNIDEQYRKTCREHFYRYIRLNPKKHAFSILRQVSVPSGKKAVITVEAKIATENEQGVFSNSSDFVKVTGDAIYADGEGDKLRFLIVGVKPRLGRIDPGMSGESVGLTSWFNELSNGELRVTISHEMIESDIPDADGRTTPSYFQCGFRRDVTGINEMPDDEVRNAMKSPDGDTIILRRPHLILYFDEKKPLNLTDLKAQANAIAEPYLRDVGKPKLIHAKGFAAAELNGRIPEIKWDQQKLMTTIQVNTWFLPAGAMQKKKEKEKEAYPQQAQAAAERMSSGKEGASQPAVPLAGGATDNAATVRFYAMITGATRQGTKWKWIYNIDRVEKEASGYSGWKRTGKVYAAYNLAEDQNDSSGLLGNGVNTGNLAGTGMSCQPVPQGRIVEIQLVRVTKAGVEYWFDSNNAIDGSCA